MSDINVNWGAAPVPQDYTAAALEGAQAGQAQRGISALQGIDLNDPDSLNRGIGNLVRAGAADQASALMGLQLKRTAVQMAPGILAGLAHLGSPQPATAPAPAQAPSIPPGTAAPVSATPTGTGGASAPASPDPKALAAVNAQMAADARAYSQATPDQQPAMATALKQKYLAMGFPEASIDSALAHAATPGGADQLAAHYDAHAQALTGGTPDPAAIAPPGNTYDWTKKLLGDPSMIAGLNFLKGYGIDYTGVINEAQKIAAPEISKEAEQAHAEPIAAATAAGKATQETIDGTLLDGSKITLPKPLGMQLAAAGAFHSPSLEAAAASSARGTEEGKSGYNVLEAPTGVPGQTVKYRLMPDPHGGPPIPTLLNGGAMPAGFGTTPTTGANVDAETQAHALSTEAEAANQRLLTFPAAIGRGEALIGIANKVGTGAYTDALKNISQYLPGATAQKYATNAGLLAQDLAASFKDSLNGLPLPRIGSEAKAVTGAIPASASPQDQVKVYAAGLLASTQYQQAHDQFIQQWAADPSKPRNAAQAEAAWQATAGGKSIFTQPAWKNITVGGEPAVQVHTFNGHTGIVPLHGLLGKNAIPVFVN